MYILKKCIDFHFQLLEQVWITMTYSDEQDFNTQCETARAVKVLNKYYILHLQSSLHGFAVKCLILAKIAQEGFVHF